jgi:hypothetical protein
MKKLIVLILCLVLLGSLATAAIYKQVPIRKTADYHKVWSWKNLFKSGGGITAAAVANFQPKQVVYRYQYVAPEQPQEGKYYDSATGNSVYEGYNYAAGKYYTSNGETTNWRPSYQRCDYFGFSFFNQKLYN